MSLNHASSWCKINHMLVNLKKSKYMVVAITTGFIYHSNSFSELSLALNKEGL